jgi:hypothetical protein
VQGSPSPPPTKRLVVGRFRFGCDETGGPFRPAFGEVCTGAFFAISGSGWDEYVL